MKSIAQLRLRIAPAVVIALRTLRRGRGADVDRMTRQDVERLRKTLRGGWVLDGNELNALCDLALQSLDRDAVLEIIARAIPFVAAYPAGSKQAGELCAKLLVDMNYALKREPSAEVE